MSLQTIEHPRPALLRKRRVCVPWFNTEIVHLRRLYATASWDEIERAIPRHSRNSIIAYARKVGVRRDDLKFHGRSQHPDPMVRSLLDLRLSNKISLAEMARRAGVDRIGLRQIEHGQMPKLATLRKIAAAFGLELVLRPVCTQGDSA